MRDKKVLEILSKISDFFELGNFTKLFFIFLIDINVFLNYKYIREMLFKGVDFHRKKESFNNSPSPF